MNEQIKLLAEQADLLGEFTPTKIPGRYVGYITEEQILKFAELIVRECLDIADGQKKWVEDMEVFNEQDAAWNKARIQQSQHIVDKIKKHFGVKE